MKIKTVSDKVPNLTDEIIEKFRTNPDLNPNGLGKEDCQKLIELATEQAHVYKELEKRMTEKN